METTLKLRLIKLADIGLLGIYYTISALLIITVFNKFFQKLFEKQNIKEVSTKILILQVCLEAASIGILAYHLRHFVRNIPFPFDGVDGYRHFKTKEINGGILISFSVLTAFTDFKQRINELIFRINKGYLNI